MRAALVVAVLVLSATLMFASALRAEPRLPGAAAPAAIRVAVVLDARAVDVKGTDIDVLELGVCQRCARLGWRTDLVRATANARGVEADGHHAIAFRLQSERPMRINGREYAGALDLLKNGEALTVVDELPLEEYLVGVLRAETGDRWPQEALRAQAIVSRTYAAYQRQLNAARPYHLTASTAHQQFAGRVSPASPAWEAVRETAGQVLRWEGQLFAAFYHTDSGGYTEDPRLVFATRNIPALKPVYDAFAAGSPFSSWSLDVKLVDLSEILRRNEVGVGAVTAVEVAERTPSLRASIVAVHGSRGSVRLRGNDFRRMVGYDTLKSTLFAVALDADTAHFSGRGWGHGVGLCQWGARTMAEQGYRARQILEYYYRGATLGWIDER
jgi:stage II sporulation protein D (peptidoglycan lytic transglycosylase)